MELLGGIQERNAEVSDRGSNFGLSGGEGRSAWILCVCPINSKCKAQLAKPHFEQFAQHEFQTANNNVTRKLCTKHTFVAQNIFICMHA